MDLIRNLEFIMSIIRIYLEQSLKIGSQIIVKGNDFHYLKNVMRVFIGLNINVFNQIDGEFKAVVSSIDRHEIILIVKSNIRSFKDEYFNDVELILSPIRHARFDFLIEKITELGVKIISPIISDNSSVKNVNVKHISEVIKQAVEQSRRLSLPVLNELVTFKSKINQFDFKNRTLIYLDERQNGNNNELKCLKKYYKKPVSFLIGPEGGFSSNEFKLLDDNRAISLSLGSRILRSETAGISIIAIYNLLS